MGAAQALPDDKGESQLTISQQQALLERLRFERSMGLEWVRAIPFPELAGKKSAQQIELNEALRQSQGYGQFQPEKLAPAARQIGLQAEGELTKLAKGRGDAVLSSKDKETRWRDLEDRAMGCVKCELHKGRTKVVFGTGNRSAQLVFVGEGPGADEDQQGIPFVGRSGQLLDKIMAAMDWKREDVFICNVVKCRPPDNRTPLPDEVAACSPYLVEQLELIAPKVIVTLGGSAAKALLKVTAGIMSIRGKWHSFQGIPVMPTYHPAFLLHQYTEENRRAVWDDMKKAKEKLGANT